MSLITFDMFADFSLIHCWLSPYKPGHAFWCWIAPKTMLSLKLQKLSISLSRNVSFIQWYFVRDVCLLTDTLFQVVTTWVIQHQNS